jgi:hypothetical protein
MVQSRVLFAAGLRTASTAFGGVGGTDVARMVRCHPGSCNQEAYRLRSHKRRPLTH